MSCTGDRSCLSAASSSPARCAAALRPFDAALPRRKLANVCDVVRTMSSSAFTPETEDALRSLLRQTFGAHAELVTYTIANRRPDYVVLLADLTHPALRVAIKLAGPQASYVYPFERTAMLHKLVSAQTSIPMPDVIAVDTSYRRWPWRYLIKTYIPGEEWTSVRQRLSPPELRSAYRQLGQAVAELHTIRCAAFGELTPDKRADGHADFVSALARRADHSIQSPRLRRLFLKLIDERAALFADVQIATLVHVPLDRPPDRPTDWLSAAAAARGRGMRRLAERLEKLAGT